MNIIRSKKGQALVEYLMLVALMAVASFSIIQLLNHSVKGKFAQIIEKIQGQNNSQVRFDKVEKSDYQKRDMSDFMHGAAIKDE